MKLRQLPYQIERLPWTIPRTVAQHNQLAQRSISSKIHTYIHTCMYIHVHESSDGKYIHKHIHKYIYIRIYIYMYVDRNAMWSNGAAALGLRLATSFFLPLLWPPYPKTQTFVVFFSKLFVREHACVSLSRSHSRCLTFFVMLLVVAMFECVCCVHVHQCMCLLRAKAVAFDIF